MSFDIFQTLTSGGGIRFDTKRFSSDAQLFAPPASSKAGRTSGDPGSRRPEGKSTKPAVHAQLDLPPELDFFASLSKKSKADSRNSIEAINCGAENGTGKRKRSALAADEEDTQNEAFQDPQYGFGPLDPSDVNAFSRANRLRLSGNDVPAPLVSWHELRQRWGVHPSLIRHIAEHEWFHPTPIQKASMAALLSGRDVFANAPTGSGKTLAYCLPILHSLGAPRPKSERAAGARALVVAPTRELAAQIHDTLVVLAYGKEGHRKGSKRWKIQQLGGSGSKSTSGGGTASQAHRIKAPDVLISTPLRLIQAVQEEEVDLREVELLVLDEADRLLEENFLSQVDSVLAATSHPARRTALFSATLPSGTALLAQTFTMDPVRIAVGQRDGASEDVRQHLHFVGSEEGKLWALKDLVRQGRLKPPALLFVQSNERANHLFHSLVYDGLRVDTMHAHRTPAQRQHALDNLKSGQTWALIATDVLARGIDLQGIQTVLNYDFPQSTQTYIHRIGRTGRAGHTGEAITFFTTDDAPYLKLVVNVMRASGCEVPEWMLELKGPSSGDRKRLRQHAPKRQDVREADGVLPAHLRGNRTAKHPKALENLPQRQRRKGGRQNPGQNDEDKKPKKKNKKRLESP